MPDFLFAEVPVNTFLENITVNAIGTLFVTSYEDGVIYEINPTGQRHEFARVDGKTAGLAFDQEGDLLVSGATAQGISAVFKVAQSGVETLVTIADAMRHLDQLRQEGLITEYEFEQKRRQLLDRIH